MSQPRSAWIAHIARALVLSTVLLTACQSDRRITVAELTELEKAGAGAPETPVVPKDLGLTDYHPYKVRPGDILSVKLIGLLEDRFAPTLFELRVHSDGRIFPPIVDALKVAHLDLGEVESALTSAYVPAVVKEKSLSVFVQLGNSQDTTVLVQGAATAPGLVRLRENERNLLYALALASGFGPTSSGRVRLKPIRGERGEIAYDLNDVNDVRRALLAEPLESGDVLEVEASDESAVYVAGLVNRSGPILIPHSSKLSVLRAVMAAGGLRDYLAVKEATLVRSLPNGEQVHVKLALGEMLAGREPDLALKPGDILHIPYTPATFAQEWFFRNVLLGPVSVGLHYDPLAQYNAERALQNSNLNNSVLGSIRGSLGSTIPNLFVPPVAVPATGQ